MRIPPPASMNMRNPFLMILGMVVAVVPSEGSAQVAARLLSPPSGDAIKCVSSSRVSRPGQNAVLQLNVYHIGASAFQVRGAGGQPVMVGPPPRVAIGVFDPQGSPVALIDSVFGGWETWAATIEFDPRSRRESYRQVSSVDSAEAMIIAMRLGPARLMEAGDSAERLRKFGPKEALDSLALHQARELAALLWQRRCP